MLRITIRESTGCTTFQLEGKLTGPWVRELEQAWVKTEAAGPGGAAVVDLAEVAFIDAAGRELLARMYGRGVELRAAAPLNSAIVEGIRAKCKPVLMVLCSVVLSVCGARAQQAAAAGAPLRLTLKDAVQMALRQNPQVHFANLNVAQSQQDVLLARAGLLPQVGLQASERAQRFNIEALLGKPFAGNPQHVGPFAVFQSSVAWSVPVFDLTLWNRWRASKEVTRVSSALYRGTREQVAWLVLSQYLGSLRADADVAAAQSRVDLAQALYTLASDLLNAGVGTGIDALRANVELQNERQRLITSQTTLRTSLLALASLLSVEPGRPIELADRVSFFETPPINVDESLAAAYANRPEMQALRAQEAANRLQERAAVAARYPTLSFDGNWGYQGLETPWAAIPAYNYGAGVTIPLFTGGRISAERARAALETRKTIEQQTATRNQISQEVQTAAAQLAAARNEVDVANMGVKLAREEVTQARDRFQAGVVNNIEVITAQDALARALDNQIAALYRYNQARADLARAAGQVEAIFAK